MARRERRVKNADVPPDYHQICGTAVNWDPSLPTFFPFCHRNSVDPLYIGFCPSVKGQLKWRKSHKTNFSFLWQKDFQCQRISILCSVWVASSLSCGLGEGWGRLTLADEPFLFPVFSFSYLIFAWSRQRRVRAVTERPMFSMSEVVT